VCGSGDCLWRWSSDYSDPNAGHICLCNNKDRIDSDDGLTPDFDSDPCAAQGSRGYQEASTLNAGIIGGSVGGVLLLILIVALVLFLRKRKQHKRPVATVSTTNMRIENPLFDGRMAPKQSLYSEVNDMNTDSISNPTYMENSGGNYAGGSKYTAANHMQASNPMYDSLEVQKWAELPVSNPDAFSFSNPLYHTGSYSEVPTSAYRSVSVRGGYGGVQQDTSTDDAAGYSSSTSAAQGGEYYEIMQGHVSS